MVFRVVVANVLEVELTIESNEPTSETEEKFCERWVHIEIVLA